MAAAKDTTTTISPELLANLGFHNAADLEALRGFVARPLGIMPRRTRMMKVTPDMEKAGLEIIPTTNNGNCFFAAISDQVHGDFEHAAEYRKMTVEYVVGLKDLYKHFLVVKRGGGTRETIKRKNAGGYSASVDHGPASEEAFDLQFKNRMEGMARDGTYAEHIELHALATILGINIKIFAPDHTSYILGEPETPMPIAGVAYDPVAQHYSSVRRVGTSRSGPGLIEVGPVTSTVAPSIEEQTPDESIPAEKQTARQLSLASVDLLQPEQWIRSRSSTPGSISIQREDDDDLAQQIIPKRSASVRKIRTASSRKPSKLSKKVSAAPSPSTRTSRDPSPEAVIVLATDPASHITAQTSTPLPETTPSPTPASPVMTAVRSVPSLPSPPYTQSSSRQSGSPSVVVISDDEDEDQPTTSAMRRRSSQEKIKEKEGERLMLLEAKDAKKPIKKTRGRKMKSSSVVENIASNTAAAPAIVSESTPKRSLRRGTRGRKAAVA